MSWTLIIEDDPVVTVILVNYNGGTMIMELLKVLEKQTYERFNLLILDNGSSDGSTEIIKRYSCEGPFLDRIITVFLDQLILHCKNIIGFIDCCMRNDSYPNFLHRIFMHFSGIKKVKINDTWYTAETTNKTLKLLEKLDIHIT